jgi:hypothetical protein
MKTAEEILNKTFTLGEFDEVGNCNDPFYDKEDVINAMEEYADQFKPKWNVFTSNRSNDPKFGEYVLIVSQYKPDKPILMMWDNVYGVIEGDEWIYFKDLRQP